MDYIFLNLKRFDITPEQGGVNRIAEPCKWAEEIVKQTVDINKLDAHFVSFFPEAHIIPAYQTTLQVESKMEIGCQSCIAADTSIGGNFGAFTSQLPANSARGIGCQWTLIGHCEERAAKKNLITQSGGSPSVINQVLNQQIKCAINAGLQVLYCIGETAEELDHWQEVLAAQLEEGLKGVDLSRVVIAYEPIWAIGPGKTPPGRERIQETARYIYSLIGRPVVYGGGLKAENASMLASIPEISGGLIALTRFSGEIGFYPNEYLEIANIYLNNKQH